MKRHHDKCPGCDEALLKKATEGHERMHKTSAFSKLLSIKGSCDPCVKGYSCKRCAFAAVHREALAWHMTKVHDEQIKCPHCDFSSAHNSVVNIHVRTVHTNKKDFKCKLCDEAFVYISLLRQHKKKVHDLCRFKSCDDTVKNLKCDLCSSFGAAHKEALAHHKYLAHRQKTIKKTIKEENLKTFTCDKCPHQTSSQGDNSIDILELREFLGTIWKQFF